MTKITVRPNEGSTYAIDVDFQGLDGEEFTPKTCTWTLTDPDGNVINGREGVTATVTGTSHTFVLSGDDLVYAPCDGVNIFTVEGTFDATYGTDLPFRDQAQFIINDMVYDG